MKLDLLAVLTLVCAMGSLGSEAREAKRTWYVDAAKGNDGNSGASPDQAFQTLGRASKQLRGGEMLVVGPGTYFECPEFENMESSREMPVWIRAEPRGSATISAAWKESALGQVAWRAEGGGIYSAPKPKPVLFGWTAEHLFLPRYLDLEHLKSGELLLRGGKRKLQAPAYGFVWKEGVLYVKLPEQADPNGNVLMFSRPSWGESSAQKVLRISNSPGVIVDGFRIEGTGTIGIALNGSPGCTIRNCVFNYCREGVGASDETTIEWCEYAYPGLYEFAETMRKASGKIGIYPITKDYYPQNWWEGSLATSMSDDQDPSPKQVEVRYAYMHDVFDGLTLGAFDDSSAHHCVFLHCYDNCVELESWQSAAHSKNLRFHHNLLLSCPSAPLSHQESNEKQSLEGPHYVYRNVVVGYDDHGWSPWVVIKSNCHKIKGLFYYHNLIWMKSAELYWNEKEWPQEWLSRTAFKNNIFIFDEEMKRPTGPHVPLPFAADGNIVIAPKVLEALRQKLQGPKGKALPDMAALKLQNPSEMDFTVLPGSPVVDACEAIATFNDAMQGAAPDCGPFELGEQPGPDWPRPRKTVFNSAAPAAWTGQEVEPKLESAADR